MTNKEALVSALLRVSSHKWASVALSALESDDLKFAGHPDHSEKSNAQSSASDLVRIYENKLQHAQRANLLTVGIPELLSMLKSIPRDRLVIISPFNGKKYSVTSFFDEDQVLVGCVTVLRNEVDFENKGIEIALRS